MKPLRFGVVGTGSVALRGILPHVTQADVQDRLRLTAVCDVVQERAEAAAVKFGAERSFADFEAMLDADAVDAVSLASPIGVHFEQGMLAVQRGVHVHFNKSMTTTTDEADALIAEAEKRGVKLVASPGEMLRPKNRAARRFILDGGLGRVVWAATGAAFGAYHENEAVRQGDDPLSNINPAWYYKRPGGGPLYDMTVYGLHTLTGILGPAKRVTAFSGTRIPEREFRGERIQTEMDDNTFITVDFGEALFAFVYGSAAGGLNAGRASIFGTRGNVSDGKFNGAPIEYPGREEIESRAGQGELPHVTGVHRELPEAHVFEDIMQLVDWVREGTPTIVTAEHARHVVEIFDAGYRSAREGRAMDLRTSFEPLF